MRFLLTALICLMLFTTPVVAGDFEDGVAAYKAGDKQKAYRLWGRLKMKRRTHGLWAITRNPCVSIGSFLHKGTRGRNTNYLSCTI